MFDTMLNGPMHEKGWHEMGEGDRKTQEELLRKEFADAGSHSQRLLDASTGLSLPRDRADRDVELAPPSCHLRRRY
jgi:hypothetical protein